MYCNISCKWFHRYPHYFFSLSLNNACNQIVAWIFYDTKNVLSFGLCDLWKRNYISTKYFFLFKEKYPKIAVAFGLIKNIFRRWLQLLTKDVAVQNADLWINLRFAVSFRTKKKYGEKKFQMETNAKIEWNLICLKRIYMQTFDSRRMRKQKHTHTPKSVENIRVTQRTFCSHSIDECVSKRNKKYNVFFFACFCNVRELLLKKVVFFFTWLFGKSIKIFFTTILFTNIGCCGAIALLQISIDHTEHTI